MRDLETWQKILLLVVIPVALVIVGIISREIYFAVHPDKRPVKRRRRPDHRDH